jgi:2-oxoglutarate ferredoxin oxidoreductase subunit alpha
VVLTAGNALIARGALAAGCNFFSGYPITPASEIYAEMMRLLPERGGVAVGAPDEISALSYAVGASLAGARAMTATSGPGWALMIETVQYALMTETPVVIAVSQRLGPATGGATQGAQGDVLLVGHATSGGYPIPVLAPVDAHDCYALTAEAFRWAEALRTPVVLLTDKETSKTVETVDLDALPACDVVPRRAAAADRDFTPYGIESLEDVPAFAPVGGRHKVTATGSAHDEMGNLKKNDPGTLRQLHHLSAKVRSRASDLERVRHSHASGARTLLVSYGVTARACRQVAAELETEGRPVDLLEILSLFPVPEQALRAAAAGVERVVIAEENEFGLYAGELRPRLPGVEIHQVNGIGAMLTPTAIREAVLA